MAPRDLASMLVAGNTPSPLKVIYAQVAAVYPSASPPNCSILLPGTSVHIDGIRLTTACKDVAFGDNVAVLMNGTDPVILAVFQTATTARACAMKAWVYLSSPAMPTGASIVPLNVAQWGAGFNTTTHRWTCASAGLYSIKGHVRVNLNNNPQTFQCSIYVNGTELSKGDELTIRGGTAGDAISSSVGDDLELAVGDYVELWMSQGGGNSVTLIPSYGETFLAVHRISA